MACDSDCVLGGGELVVRIPRDAYKDYPSLIIGSEWPSIPVTESSSAIHSLKTVMLAARGGSLAWKFSLLSAVTFSAKSAVRRKWPFIWLCVFGSVQYFSRNALPLWHGHVAPPPIKISIEFSLEKPAGGLHFASCGPGQNVVWLETHSHVLITSHYLSLLLCCVCTCVCGVI